MDENKETTSDSSENWLLKGLQVLYNNQKHCDVEIKIQKQSFHCHKVVLSAASGYFDTMFTSGLREASLRVVELKDTSSETFAEILEFVYNRKNVIKVSNVEDLLHAACFLQIPRLKDECEEFLLAQLSPESCIGLWLTARSLCCNGLSEASWDMIMESFDEVIEHEEFLKLEKQDFIEIIKSDKLRTKTEDNVCKAGVVWIHANEKLRKKHLTEIFSEIRLCQVELEFLLNEIYTNPLIYTDRKCMKLLTKAVQYHALPDRRHMSESLDVRLRSTSNSVSLLVVIGRIQSSFGKHITEIFGFNLHTKKWYTLCSMPVDVGDDFATCPYGNDIFVSGGTNKCDAMLRFTAKQNKWFERLPMVQGRYRHSMVAISDSIFAVGGYSFGIISSVEEYDISSNTWLTVGHLRQGVDAAAAAVYGQKLFVFGGCQGFETSTTAIQCFDTETYESSIVTYLPSPQRDAKALTFNSTTYIVCTNGEMLSFKPDLTIRRLEKHSPFKRKNFGLYMKDKTVFLLGGDSATDDESFEEDVATLNDDILPILELGSETATFPNELPVPIQVFGCFQTVIKVKYPMSEVSEQWSLLY